MKNEELAPELQEKAKACETEEKLRELADAVGTGLSDEELEAMAGGAPKGECSTYMEICRNKCPTKGSCKGLFS